MSNACVNTMDDLVSIVEEESELADTIEGFVGRVEDGSFSGHVEMDTQTLSLSSDFSYVRNDKILPVLQTVKLHNGMLIWELPVLPIRKPFK